MTPRTTPALPFAAYRGDGPYVFVSYSHGDVATVYPEFVQLRAEGFNIWYDDGIGGGHRWTEELATRIERCALFLLFVSPRSVESENCMRETHFALSRHKPVLAVHLEVTKLPAGLDLAIGDRQAVIRPRLNEQAYRQKLNDAISEYVSRAASSDPEPIQAAATGLPRWIDARRHRQWLVTAVAMVIIAITLTAYYRYEEAESARGWALEQAIPQAERLEQEGRFFEAYVRANAIERIVPDDHRLAALWPKITERGSLRTEPPQANVFLRPLSNNSSEWTHLGISPLDDIRLPRGPFALKVEKPGFPIVHVADINPGRRLGNIVFMDGPEPVVLRESVPQDQVFVPAIADSIRMSEFPDFYETGPFLIDRHEITNRQFKEFVDAGGYRQQELWEAMEFVDQERRKLTWSEAIATFIDSTGRAGPATWELGRYRAGEADWPVSGVSWYEAVAYARYRGRDLPTRFHWGRAATTWYLSNAIVTLSNFSGDGPARVGQYGGLGPFGTYDMAGNVREWVWNARLSQRYILGGAWSDPKYLFTLPSSRPPIDRSPTNGFRTVLYLDDGPTGQQLAGFEGEASLDRNYSELEPYSDESFRSLADQFDYSKREEVGATLIASSDSKRGWRHETVLIDSTHVAGGFKVHLFLPVDVKDRVQPVVFFPGMYSFMQGAASETIELMDTPLLRQLDFVIASGRALVWPVYHGSYERHDGLGWHWSGMTPEQANALRMRLVRWRSDVGEVLDYLATRADLSSSSIGYIGYSYGAGWAPVILSLERRIKAAVLISGSITPFSPDPFTDTLHYLPRVRQPTLVLSGRYDPNIPIEGATAMYRLLGTAERDKKHVIFPIGHDLPPRTELMEHAANWLDRYLGPP